MVKRLWSFISQEVKGLHQAAYILGFFAFLSQILALIRDRLLAGTFGAGETLDLYYAAFRIPDLIFVTAASIVSLSVLIPFLVDASQQGQKEAKEFIDSIFSFFFLFITAVSVCAFFLLPYILPVVFPGFSETQIDTLIPLSRILLLSPFFLGLSNLFGSIIQVIRRFLVYALSPLLYNTGIIVGIIFLSPVFQITGVVIGVAFGALLHFSIQIPAVVSSGLSPSFSFSPNFSKIRKVFFLSLPRTFTLAISHLVILLLLSFASLQAIGSISVFNFSYNLQSISLSIIGVSYSLAAFPTLAHLFSSGDTKKFLAHILVSARHIIFWSIPVAVLFVVLRAQIVRVILGTGEFDWADTRLTAAALALFVFSVVFQSLALLFVRGYYSAGETLKPLVINAFSGVFTIISAVALMFLFKTNAFFQFFIESLLRVEGLSGTEVLMLPLAFSIGSVANGLLLWVMFEFDFDHFSEPLLKTFSHIFSASIIMGFYSYISLNILSRFLNLDTFIGIFLQGFIAGVIGITIGILVLGLLENEELVEVTETFKKKIWKTEAISPDTTDIV